MFHFRPLCDQVIRRRTRPCLTAGRPTEDLPGIHPEAGTRRAYAPALRAYLDSVRGPQHRQGGRTCSTPGNKARYGDLAARCLAAGYRVTVLVPAEYKVLKSQVTEMLQAHGEILESMVLENVQLKGRLQQLENRNATIPEAARVLEEIGEYPRRREAPRERERE